jgi:ubiquinone/menaquinone biosynthesis C-methylase UbiE
MSLYSHYVVPCIVGKTCATKPIMKQREKVVPLAEGCVLEIGVGGGLNFAFYNKTKVTKIYGLDTSPKLMEQAVTCSRKSELEFEPILLSADQIPINASEIDTVLVTYTLCSIDALQSALKEMRRVLKPTGRLIFCEHGAAPDFEVNRWQKRLTPLWRRFGGGCRLDRQIPQEIEISGFNLTSIEHMYLPGTWRVVGYNSWGTAVPDL